MRIETTEALIGHRPEFQAGGDLAVYQREVEVLGSERLYRIFPASRGTAALQGLATHFDRFTFTSHSMHLV